MTVFPICKMLSLGKNIPKMNYYKYRESGLSISDQRKKKKFSVIHCELESLHRHIFGALELCSNTLWAALLSQKTAFNRNGTSVTNCEHFI